MSPSEAISKLSKKITWSGGTFLAAASIALGALGESVAAESLVGDMRKQLTPSEVAEDFEAYEGRVVTIRQDVDRLVGDYAFLLDEDRLFGGEELLVINATQAPFELIDGEGTQVQVTGEVRQFSLAVMEQELNVDLEADLLADYEGRPVILANSIALSPNPGEITNEPERYYFRRIAVEGEVQSIYGLDTLTLKDQALFGGEDLLVFNPQADTVVQAGENVVVTGTLRPFTVTEIEQEYDLTWDLDLRREIEAEFENRPVFIADEIYPF